MSTQPVTCPNCKTAILAEQRPSKSGTPINRAADRVAFIADTEARLVIVVCPECGTGFNWRGKRIIIVDAA